MKRVVKFAGITFSGDDRGDDQTSVRIDTFRKILTSGKIQIQLNYHLDDQGAVGNQDRTPTVEEVLAAVAEDKPNLLYYNSQRQRIHCVVHRNLSYGIIEKPVTNAGDHTFGQFFQLVMERLNTHHGFDDPYSAIAPGFASVVKPVPAATPVPMDRPFGRPIKMP